MHPNDDLDYNMLRRYLTFHYAPNCIKSALERLITRAGARPYREFPVKPKEKSPPPKPPLMTRTSVEALVIGRKTQKEIADFYGVKITDIRDFMKAEKIKPSYGNSGIHMKRKIEVVGERLDPSFPVPVRIISAGYAGHTSACQR